MLKVGLVGCGAMAFTITQFVRKNLKNQMLIQGIYDKSDVQRTKFFESHSRSCHQCTSMSQLVTMSDLIIEVAHPSVVEELVEEVFKKEKKAIIASVGGMVSESVQGYIKKNQKGKIYIPSGAIGCIDAIRSASYGNIQSIEIETTKPIHALPNQIEKKQVDEWTVFKGGVREAVSQFPKNINVAATLTLAVQGQCDVQVTIKASRVSKLNTHRIMVKSEAGDIEAVFSNRPHPDNPQTSYQAVLSICSLLTRLSGSVQVGS